MELIVCHVAVTWCHFVCWLCLVTSLLLLVSVRIHFHTWCLLQAEVTVAELVRVVSKAMLLHLPVLVAQPGFASLWVAVLNALAAAAATGSETLSEASAAVLQNLLIMLHELVSCDCVFWWKLG
jgi:hypothetical protein